VVHQNNWGVSLASFAVQSFPALKPVLPSPELYEILKKYLLHLREMAEQGRYKINSIRPEFAGIAHFFTFNDKVINCVSGWMESEGHRDNIMGSHHSQGIGISISDDDVLITQDFC
jgi:hypothetical protein